MSSTCHVFKTGEHAVKLVAVDHAASLSSVQPPPKPLLVSAPEEKGEYPVVVLLHGYLLQNCFYSQLMQHVSSHGFIVVAPQLYCIAGPDCFDEIADAVKTIDWLIHGLAHILPTHAKPNLAKLAIAGHSRGGKVAFALALGYAETLLTISVVIGIDPVDGQGIGKQTKPAVLTYKPCSFNMKAAALVIGSGLGGIKKNPFFPPCAPEGVNHQEFFDQCRAPACHLVARNYGHMDVLNDETKGIRGRATYCLCANGKAREPMRCFVGGAMVAFLKAYLGGEMLELWSIRGNPDVVVPIEVSEACFKE